MASPKRKAISNKTRFEVFKRDSFTCQYCGGKAPDVVLNVDHIEPVASGGDSDIMNLITACFGCNSGKSDRKLSDNTVLSKQRAALDELAERREQLIMLKQWRDQLGQLQIEQATFLAVEIGTLIGDTSMIGQQEFQAIRQWLAKFTVEELLNAAEASKDAYLKLYDGEYYGFQKFFWYIPRIAYNKKNRPQEYEVVSKIAYIAAILRNRFSLRPDQVELAKPYIRKAMTILYPEALIEWSKTADSFSDWHMEIAAHLGEDIYGHE